MGWSEEPLEGVTREVREEVGLSVAEKGPPEIYHAQKPRRVEWYFDMVLDGCEPADAVSQSAEIEEVRWFPLDQLPVMERKLPTMNVALKTIAERRFPGMAKIQST